MFIRSPTDLVKDLRQDLRSPDGKWEEGRDVGEHTGQNERVFGFVVEHGLQHLHALIYGQLLQGGGGQTGLASHITVSRQ